MRNVADCINILLSLDSEVLVYCNTLVFLKGETGFLEELGGWSNAGTHDDEVGGQGVLALEMD